VREKRASEICFCVHLGKFSSYFYGYSSLHFIRRQIAGSHCFHASKFDGFVKSRHSRAGGNPESAKLLKRLDSRFHGNDGKAHFQTFYEAIKFDDLVKSLLNRHPGESRGPEHLEITGLYRKFLFSTLVRLRRIALDT
jgi:hypothetical protein